MLRMNRTRAALGLTIALAPVAVAIAIAGVIVILGAPAPATAQGRPGPAFPSTIALPNGWRPEGIVRGHGTDFYVGSLANGAIYKGDLRTGEGGVLAPGQPGRVTVGLSFDDRSGYLFAAGGNTGLAHVFDTRTGERVAEYQLIAPGAFVNDVIVTREAAWFTNSGRAVLHKLPLGPGGELPDPGAVETIALGGQWTQVPGFNANGIEATPDGSALIVVHSTLGRLYRVDPATGEAAQIDLGGATVTQGDGILLDGKTLYVVRNRSNQIAVVDLADDLASGIVATIITSPAFRVPTTITELGGTIYAVNARFDVPSPGPSTDYDVVAVDKP